LKALLNVMTKRHFPNLQPQTYEHPFDRQAFQTLERTPMLQRLLNKINEYGIDKLLRLQSVGVDFRVTPHNFPELHDPFLEACEILDISAIPDLYLYKGTGHINTYALGVTQPIVGMNLEALEWLNYEEKLFLLGHELGRVKGNYLPYQQMAHVMPIVKGIVSNTTLGLGGLAANGLELALYNWMVMSKLTADRAGLLACQDIDVAIVALMKVGGLTQKHMSEAAIEDFLAQARAFSLDDFRGVDRVVKAFSFMEFRLPWTVMRASELLKWAESETYQAILHGDWLDPDRSEYLQPTDLQATDLQAEEDIDAPFPVLDPTHTADAKMAAAFAQPTSFHDPDAVGVVSPAVTVGDRPSSDPQGLAQDHRQVIPGADPSNPEDPMSEWDFMNSWD
jgi:hypothetical protein